MRRWLVTALLFTTSMVARGEMPVAVAYTLHCSGCHGEDGKGVPDKGIPDLNDAGRYVVLPIGREYLMTVPGVSQSTLDDAQRARLINYVLNRFAADRLPKNFQPYTAAELAEHRGHNASDAPVRREAILTQLRAAGLLEGYHNPQHTESSVRQ